MVATLFSHHKEKTIIHYYGDIVRKFFFAIALVMLITYPFLKERIEYPDFVSVLGMLVMVLLAGLVNPLVKWMTYVQATISILGFGLFEYYAISNIALADVLFWTNQILALLFFCAVYFSIKTARASFLHQQAETIREW
ncbi:MAG: hypothetical protein ABL890_04385 [Candidatus Peribacteraceae bacterium]